MWNEATRETASEHPLEEGTTTHAYHNGTKSRDSLPLWNEATHETASEHPLEEGTTTHAYHNGIKSRDSLPLWNEAFIGFWGTGCQILFGTPDYIEYLVLGSTSLSRCFLVTTDMSNTQDVVNSIAFNVARLGTEMACFRLMLNFDIFLTYLSSIDYILTKKHRENKEL